MKVALSMPNRGNKRIIVASINKLHNILKKHIILILALILSNLTFAQNTISQTEVELSEYNQLMNYVPKGIDANLSKRPNNKFFKEGLNSISILKAYYENQNAFKFTEIEIDWLENRINEIAVAFFLENKPILIEKAGGYAGCSENMVDKKIVNGKNVTILRFCYSCTDFSKKSDKLIAIFNRRTNLLLGSANNAQ